MQHTCLLSVISITTIFPLNLIMRRGGHSTPEKKGVEFHLLAYYSFRWQCMELFPQSLRGPFLLLVIITLLLFAHEAEYSCRGPTKKMQHTKTLLCICVHIHFFFFLGQSRKHIFTPGRRHSNIFHMARGREAYWRQVYRESMGHTPKHSSTLFPMPASIISQRSFCCCNFPEMHISWNILSYARHNQNCLLTT